MVDFSSEKYVICPAGQVKSQCLHIEDALGKRGLKNRFCLEKRPMNIHGRGRKQGLLFWTGFFVTKNIDF